MKRILFSKTKIPLNSSVLSPLLRNFGSGAVIGNLNRDSSHIEEKKKAFRKPNKDHYAVIIVGGGMVGFAQALSLGK